jgi:RNA polymerase sigma factor (sigma-70 family)
MKKKLTLEELLDLLRETPRHGVLLWNAPKQKMKNLTREQELDLILRAQRGDKGAMGELVAAHKPFVFYLMRQITFPEWMETEDILQEGCIGLMDAVRTFDVKSGNRLLTHAYWKIKKSLTNHMNKMGYMVTLPFLKLLDLKKYLNKLEQTPNLVTEEEKKRFNTFKHVQILALSIGMCSFEEPGFKQFNNHRTSEEQDDGSGALVVNDSSLVSASTEDAFISTTLYDDLLACIAQLNAVEGVLVAQYLGVYGYEYKRTLVSLVGRRTDFDAEGNLILGFNGYGVQVGKSYNTISSLVRNALQRVREQVAEQLDDVLPEMGIKHDQSA